jgi:pimeloyl-ACP methyl ester carboxylesterase
MRFTQAARRGKLRLMITAAVLAIAGLLIPVSQIASAGTTSRSIPARGPKPSIVLVHGAWADSSSWDAVVSRAPARRVHRLRTAEPAAGP